LDSAGPGRPLALTLRAIPETITVVDPGGFMKPSSIALAALLTAAATFAPRVCADVDLAGEWANRVHEDQPERGPGPEIGDFTGIPINEAARQRALGWDASLLTLPEHQCGPHPANYGAMHSNIRIWKEVDEQSQNLIAWHILHESYNRFRTVWMDGRPRPSDDDVHTWQGFSTGRWVGNALEITTTHMKESRTRRNGIEHSDRAELVELLTRHGNYLTFISILKDPDSLEEPYIHTRHFVLDLNQVIRPYPCRGAVEIDRPLGVVPHHNLGENPYPVQFQRNHGIPAEAALGGAQTLYPEYRDRLRQLTKAGSANGR
jgi:hypothetical protein